MNPTKLAEDRIGPAAGAGADAESQFLWPEDRPGEARPPQPPAGPPWRRWVKPAAIATGLAAAAAVYLAPLPPGLAAPGKAAFAVFLLCTTLWVTNALPIGITGLLAVALLGLTGAMTPADAFAAFGSSAVFFILGVFILAAALIRSGLSKRLALLFLVRFGGSAYRFALGLMVTGAIATVFMPAQATTAMLFPIAVEVAEAMKLRPLASRYGKVLFLSLAWGAMIGSNASFLGSTRAPLALGMLQESHGQTIGFGTWLLAAFPVVLLGLVTTPLILHWMLPRETIDGGTARTVLESAVAELGPIQWPQVKVGVVMLVTVAAWVFLGGRIDLASIALLAAAAMFAWRVLRWEDLEGYIHWSVVLMYGGAIALGVAIDRTGVAEWFVGHAIGDVRIPAYLAVVGLAIATLALSEVMSNAAAVAVMLPLGFSLGGQLGASPMAMVLATSIGGGLAFTLPISSAPNAIAFASGYLRMADFLRIGLLVTLASILILLLVARFWWPLIGIL